MKFYDWGRLDGCVVQRKARSTKTLVGVYAADQAGMENDPSIPWATVCEVHGTLVCHPSQRLALSHAAAPEGWCIYCRVRDHRYTCTHKGEVRTNMSISEVMTVYEDAVNEADKEDIASLQVNASHETDHATLLVTRTA